MKQNVNAEIDRKQLEARINMSYAIIAKLKTQIAELSGALAQVEVERDSYLQYARNLSKGLEEEDEAKLPDRPEVTD